MRFLLASSLGHTLVLVVLGLNVEVSLSFCLSSSRKGNAVGERVFSHRHSSSPVLLRMVDEDEIIFAENTNDVRSTSSAVESAAASGGEKSSTFSTSFRKGLKSIKSSAAMPRAIASLIRDAAQAAVEVAVEEMQTRMANDDDFDDSIMDSSFDVSPTLRSKLQLLTEELATLTMDAEKTAEASMAAAVSAAELANKAQKTAKQVASKAVAVQQILNQLMCAPAPLSLEEEQEQEKTIKDLSSSPPPKPGFSEAQGLSYSDVDFSLSSMAPPFIDDNQCLVPGEAIVRVEKAPENSRRIFAGIDILGASVDDVWNVLTDYDNLQRVVPNLVTNKVLKLYEANALAVDSILQDSQLTPEEQCRILSERLKGARLYQVGGAKIAGINFSAKTTLDVREWPEGLPDFAHYGDEVFEGKSREKRAQENSNIRLKRYNFPRPFAISSLPHKDISMQSIENDDGEFRVYQGVWRMQPLPGCAPKGGSAMRLSYAVEISPRSYLPVRLIEGRIAQDLCANLKAIRDYVTTRKKSPELVKV